ncbi:MAG: chemotaxis protein CheW [candidate division WOR-3 bacterium]|nr:chemotaxis protein CheW [candidate division WOR-3 bacterium]
MNYYLYYQIGKITIATSISEIKEVIRPKTITADEKLPKNILGWCLLRGEKLLIFDLPQFLGIKSNQNFEVIVSEINKILIGFKTEKIHGIFSSDRIIPYPDIVKPGEYMVGIIKKNGEILQVLSFKKILSGVRLRSLSRYL